MQSGDCPHSASWYNMSYNASVQAAHEVLYPFPFLLLPVLLILHSLLDSSRMSTPVFLLHVNSYSSSMPFSLGQLLEILEPNILLDVGGGC